MLERTATILNVNDDDSSRYAVSRAFRHAGFHVVEAASGMEALALLEAEPDLVLLDVHLPDVHGFKLCRELKERAAPEWLPVVLLSAVYVRDADRAAGMETGADGYMVLPADPTLLIGTVRSILRAKDAEAGLRRVNTALEATVRERTRELEATNASLHAEIARRVEIETELRKREAHFRFQAELLDAVGQAIIATDLSGTIFYWNRVAEEIYGWTAEEMVGRRLDGFVPEAAREAAAEARGLLKDGERWSGELTVRHRDGRLVPVIVTESPVYDSSGELTAVIGVSVDISDRRRAEAALRESEQRFRALFDESAVGIALVDVDGRPYRANRALVRMLGYSPEELAGMSLREITHPEDVERDGALFEEVRAGSRSSYQQEQRYLTRDGRTIWGQLTVSPVRHPDGSPWFFIGMVEDVTARMQLEAQFHQAQKMEAVGRLAGGVAHDMNNLLCVIAGYTELSLQLLTVEDAVHRSLTQVRAAAERASGLTQQLLAFSRKQLLSPRTVDPNELIRNLDRMLRRLIGEDVEMVTVLDPRVPMVRVDPGQFDQALMNLAVNARDAMPDGGQLVIETQRVTWDRDAGCQPDDPPPGCYAGISVSDSGLGMSPEVRAQIWEPFFTTKPQGKGTGLGLASVYGIVRQSGGYVRVESEQGAGSTFSLYLPAVGKAAPVERSATVPVAPRGTETVLLCEDERQVRELVRTVLQSHGYGVLEAHCGESALQLAEQHQGPIHLLLTDVVMPGGINGRELASLLAAARAEMKVLLMSGYPGGSTTIQQVAAGNVPFIQKPFDPAALVRRVREVLDQSGSDTGSWRPTAVTG